MKQTLSRLAAALGLVLALPHAALAQGAAPPAALVATGVGTVTQAPDRATVSFRIETVDEQAARASAQNNTIVTALDDALAKAGVQRSAVRTRSYSLSYNPRPPRPDPNVAVRYGYVVSRTVEASVDRVDGVGAIVDAGIGAGVTNVNGVTFGLRDPQAAYRTALTAAVADAEAQARTLATAAHVRLVRLVTIAPGARAPLPGPVLRASVLAAPAPPTVIEPGDLSANATVTLRYEIAPQ
jgi:uncharacterized protein YggE